ncbi:MAG: hypothetical protein CMF52_03005 [Legionellales bacterium]|nr:hypothetical protein [Legionellales bacterium]
MFGKKKSKTTEDSAASTETVTTETVEATEVEATETTEASADIAEATAEAVNTATDTLTVSTEDMEALTRFRLAGEDCIKELGNMEIRKARIIASYGQLENASQQKLMEIGASLGIAEGTGWSVNPDGTVTVHNSPSTTATESEAATTAE